MRRLLLVGILLWCGCKNTQAPPPPPLADVKVPGAHIKVDANGNVSVKETPTPGGAKVTVQQDSR